MLEMTDNAKKELDNYFNNQDVGTIRIYLASGGCAGLRLTLALDNARENDTLFEDKGYKFCMEQSLAAQAKDMTIDVGYMGFVINSALELGDGGTCETCDGSCG